MIPPSSAVPVASLTAKNPAVTAIVILIAAMGLRAIGFDKSAWSDEIDSYVHATAKDFIASARTNVHPPFYFALLRAATSITTSLSGLRLISLACGLAIVGLCLRAGPVGHTWAAGLLIACSPEAVYQSQELRQYALLNLLLVAAFFFALQLLAKPGAKAPRWGLAISLALAATTHLATGFFLAALGLVVGWSQRRESIARLTGTMLLFAPAALLLFFFNRFLHSVGHGLNAANWWVGAASWDQLTDSLSVALGWNMVIWCAEAVGRHVVFGHMTVLIAAGAAAVLTMWAAWTHQDAKLARTALVVALIYWALIAVYSFCSLSILLPRIMMPGAYLFVFSIGAGVALQPSQRLRRAASLGLVGLAMGMIAPWLWYLGWHPREDLRGLAEYLRDHRSPNEALVFFSGTELAADVYWPGFRQNEKFATLDLMNSLGPQESRLREILAGKPSSIVLVYREDAYLIMHRDFLAQVITSLAEADYAVQFSEWNKDYLHALRLSPAAAGGAVLPKISFDRTR